MTDPLHDASQLISRHLDGLMTDAEESRLAELMRQDSDVVDLYVRLMQVHGQLTWGAAHSDAPPAAAETPEVADIDLNADSPLPRPVSQRNSRARRQAAWAVPGTLLLLALVFVGVSRWTTSELPQMAEDVPKAIEVRESSSIPEAGDVAVIPSAAPLTPLRFDSLDVPVPQQMVADAVEPPATMPVDDLPSFVAGQVRDDDVVALIDQAISAALSDNGTLPSPPATTAEWTRRVWLTLAGRIPSIDEMSSSAAPLDATDRAAVVDRLLAGSDRSRHLAEVWTRLLVGRSERPQIDRPALQDYLLTAFEENRSWMQVVGELVSAEGRSDENGATNFLLAHLDNQATPATAVTARLFLGEQLQCVQCHHHPFAPDLRQQEYWALNAFFQNARRATVDQSAQPVTGRGRAVVLTDRDEGGMTFFETLSGRQEAVVAAYDGREIAANERVSRRAVLAELLETDSQSRVARAMVNRVWADFFGYGFTTPVDDMGPHATVSHPELLEVLTRAFVASGYDLRRLQRWIALSVAWQRSSQAIAENEHDAPESGSVPLFSRVYPQRMTPEQVYDSIRVAVRAMAGHSATVEPMSDHRRQWVSQFARPYHTDENDEADEFNGSVAQAMVMMNGDDINDAIRQAGEAFLGQQTGSPAPERVLRQVSLAVLTRAPTEQETAVFRRHLSRLRRSDGYETALPRVTEDMLWAYLNSSEFLLIH